MYAYVIGYHQYGRYWMARVLHMHNTNMHGKNSAKTERLALKGSDYYYLAISAIIVYYSVSPHHEYA